MPKTSFNIKNNYNQLRKKYKELPDFDNFNNEFEIVTIEKEDYIARRIRRRVNDKVVFYCRIIENMIYPNAQNALSAYEASFFNEEEKHKLVKVHKELMYFERKSLLLDVEAADEKENLKFILDILKKWQNFKSELTKVVKIMGESWEKDLKDDGEKYFG